MSQIAHDSWNSSNAVPHFIQLKSAEYLTDPAMIRAYRKLYDPPEDQIRFLRRISRNLQFSIWIRSVVWSCSLICVIAFTFMTIISMDFRMQSLIFPRTIVVSDEEADNSSPTLAIQSEAEEKVADRDDRVIR